MASSSSSVSGIVISPSSSSSRIVPQSVRADGSLRKERKVKPGFTPKEDIAKFRSRRLLQEDERKRKEGAGSQEELIIGLEKMGIRSHGNYSSVLDEAGRRELRPPVVGRTQAAVRGVRDNDKTEDSEEIKDSGTKRQAKEAQGLPSDSAAPPSRSSERHETSRRSNPGPSRNNTAFTRALREASESRSSPAGSSSSRWAPANSKDQQSPAAPARGSGIKEEGKRDGRAGEEEAPRQSSPGLAPSTTPDAWDADGEKGGKKSVEEEQKSASTTAVASLKQPDKRIV